MDSSDIDRIDETKEELHHFLAQDRLRDCSILIFANKQDLPRALTCSELAERLKLDTLHMHGQKWHVQPCIATTGSGIYEGFEWLSKQRKWA